MAMMVSTRRELSVQRYPWIVVLLAPLVALFLQSYIPHYFSRFDLIDLPLLVVIYFAVGWRNPVAGTIFGTIVGLLQDGLTNRPLGVNGISKCVVGFFAASVGVKIAVENPGTRLLMNFVFTLLNTAIYLVIVHRLLALGLRTDWVHEAIRAVINSIVGVFVFDVLDRTRAKD